MYIYVFYSIYVSFYSNNSKIDMGKYQIDGKTFDTIKSAKQHVRSILSSVKIHKPLKKENQQTFKKISKLLERHPGAFRKGVIDQYGKNIIDDIEVQHNMKKDLELKMIRQDGSQQVISWVQCINPKQKTHRQKLNSAMRQAISNQILEFKQKYPNPQSKCANQNCHGGSFPDCDVDHQIRFKDLQEQYFKSHPEQLIKDFDDCSVTNQKKFKKQDQQWQNKWTQFHKQKAKLRWLCHSCNLQRRKTYVEGDDY